jgi:hypothetical protein
MSGNVASPVWQMWRNGTISVWQWGRMKRVNPPNVAAPALPASTMVDHLRCLRDRDAAGDARDDTVLHRDVEQAVQLAGRIQDRSAFQQQIVHLAPLAGWVAR